MPSAEELKKTLPRHERLPDVLGASMDPHPVKTRRVEWVGQASPLDNPLVAFRLVNGMYTPLQEQAIRKAAAEARTRGGSVNAHGQHDPHRIRLLEHAHVGASVEFRGIERSYIFSPKNGYIQDVTYHDFDIIFSSNVADEFRWVDDPDRPPGPRAGFPTEESIAIRTSHEAVLLEDREPGLLAKT